LLRYVWAGSWVGLRPMHTIFTCVLNVLTNGLKMTKKEIVDSSDGGGGRAGEQVFRDRH